MNLLLWFWFILGSLTVTESNSPQQIVTSLIELVKRPREPKGYTHHSSYRRHPYYTEAPRQWQSYSSIRPPTPVTVDQTKIVTIQPKEDGVNPRTTLANTKPSADRTMLDPVQPQSPSPKQIADSLIQFVNRPLQPKGEPLPTIPGPKTDERVCIVGAGPSGVHMALRLKELNYQNVEIFEASGYIGGKAKDYVHQNYSYSLGALLLYRTYTESIVPLFEKYAPTEFQRAKGFYYKETNRVTECEKATSAEYLFPQIGRLTGLTDPKQIGAKVIADVKKYYEIHQDMFGKFEGFLMNKPSSDVLYRIRGTFKDFLEREGLISLVPIVETIVISYLYGSIGEEGALYYLMEPCNSIPLSAALSILGATDIPHYPFIPRDTTFAKMFKAIVEKENLNVRYHSEVVNIHHEKNGKVLMDISRKGTSRLDREECDFVIWTALATQLIKNYPDASDEERRLFTPMYTHEAASSVVKKKDDIRVGPVVHYVEGAQNRGDKVAVLSEGYLGDEEANYLFQNVTLGEWQNNRETKVSVVYQEGVSYKADELVENELLNHFKGLGATEIDILTSEKWDYFPRWSAEELQGKHWELFAIQGKRNIWYAGASGSFETVLSVVEYNNHLLRQMEV